MGRRSGMGLVAAWSSGDVVWHGVVRCGGFSRSAIYVVDGSFSHGG